MKNFLEEIYVVIVVHRMSVSKSPAYHSLTIALGSARSISLLVYDNSPVEQVCPESLTWDTVYTHDPSNRGVGKAYNECFKRAREKDKKWMLLADQDTVFPPNSFEEYEKSVTKNDYKIFVPVLKDNTGIVSPFKFFLGGGQRVTNPDEGKLKPGDFFFANSGLLISTEVFGKIGGYDEQFKLDFSDIDFTLRLRNVSDFFIVSDLECEHTLTSLDHGSEEVLLNRFQLYVHASRAFKKKYPDFFWIPIRVFWQAVKKSLQHKNFAFMIAYLK